MAKPQRRKRVLIICYYWPPAGGPGVQRWLQFVKYLPDFGIEPVVYIPENPSYPIIDESLCKEVAAGLEIIRAPIIEPYAVAEKINPKNKDFKAGQFDTNKRQSWLSKLSVFVRGNFFIPDARVLWVRPSARFLTKYLAEHPVDTIVTSGPPHSLHLIGLRLKKTFPALRWVADFRDPWTEISYFSHLKLTKWAKQYHHTLEEKVFQTADQTIATSFTDAKNFSAKGANAICITNGFDQLRKSEKSPNSQYVIRYVGMLEQLRNPIVFWEALAELMAGDAQFAHDLAVQFVGKVDQTVLRDIRLTPLASKVSDLGYQSSIAARKLMEDADLLLLTNFPHDTSSGIIPGKLFEYLATGVPIISFGPANSDVDQILTSTEAGRHFTYQDKEAVQKYIRQQYVRWQKGEELHISSYIQEYSRKNLTARLAEIL